MSGITASGPGNIYDPKSNQNAEYWKAVEEDLKRQAAAGPKTPGAAANQALLAKKAEQRKLPDIKK